MYPISSKRGFPEGYLSGLEQRLADTEFALFATIARQSNLNIPENTRELFHIHAERQSKTFRSQEWRRLPVATSHFQWFNEKWTSLELRPEGIQLTGPALTPGPLEGIRSVSEAACVLETATSPISHADVSMTSDIHDTLSWSDLPQASTPQLTSQPRIVESPRESRASLLSRQQSHRFF